MTLDALLVQQAALYALGSLGADAMRATIDRALDEGIYLDDFIDAVHPGPFPPFDQPAKAFLGLLAVRSVAVPDRRDALWRVVASHVHRIADARNDARVELAALIEAIYHQPELRTPSTKFVGDAFGIEQLIGNHWGFDELATGPEYLSCGGFHGAAAIEHLERLTRVEARRWLDAHDV